MIILDTLNRDHHTFEPNYCSPPHLLFVFFWLSPLDTTLVFLPLRLHIVQGSQVISEQVLHTWFRRQPAPAGD